MILSILLPFVLRQASTGVSVIEGARPDVIQVEAFVRIPQIGPHERAALALVVDTLLEDTEDFGNQDLLEKTSLGGDPIAAELLPDCVHIHFAVPASDPVLVMEILDNVLHGSRPSEENLKQVQQDAPFDQKSPWDTALNPERPNIAQVRLIDVHPTYRRFFTADRITIEIAAPLNVVKTDFAADWKTHVEAWEAESLPLRLHDIGHLPVVTERPGQLTTIVLRGPTVPATNPAQALLASFALGGGKGALVFQALRERLGWSYRQEAPLMGVPDGLQQDIVLISKTGPDDFDHAQAIKPAVLDAIDKWTEADRTRALGAAKAWLLRGVGVDTLGFFGPHPEPAYIQGYWRMKTGGNFDVDEVLRAMEAVTLDSLKTTAKATIDKAGLEVIRGKD